MIIDFDDSCWSDDGAEWTRNLVQVLVILAIHEQHAVVASPDYMLPWCADNLPSHLDYFKTRLATAQCRANALTIYVAPNGANAVAGLPPWTLAAKATQDLVNRPLRLVLENDRSDRTFLESTVTDFSRWCQNGWVVPAMGGGTAMEKDIAATANDGLAKWRTFYLFDSDRLHPSELEAGWAPPGGDGCQGHRFEVACTGIPTERWHRLTRRSIENYLPQTVLSVVNAPATSALFSPSVGAMANFFNLKTGLKGDGVSPADPKKTVRASRCQGFWMSLSSAEVTALENGFGPKVADEFSNVPEHHPWPADVVNEMYAMADALRDAM